MCGINGIYSLSNTPIPNGIEIVQRMNGALQHRGPDDQGVWANANGSVVLGHRRLSIIDLSSAGRQPMTGPDGTVIVFNGEIYNYRELATDFRDPPLATSSDTEVLLRSLERSGVRAVDDLNGMFALVHYDPKRHTLRMARDRVGKKPLYYAVRGDYLVFSSEIRALLEAPWIDAQLDHRALYDFLTFNLVPPPATMFDGIYKLPPAHWMEITNGEIKPPRQYWQIEYESVPSDEEQLCELIRERFASSVRYRMVSDVPVGAFLSGGVDSSAVIASMRQQTSASIKTFAIGFEGQSKYDESDEAASIARRFQTDHHTRMVTHQDIAQHLPRVVGSFDEPLADPTSIPILLLAEMAKNEGIKVILTGDGPDELFLGYRNWQRYYRLYPWYRRYLRTPRAVRSLVASAYGMRGKQSATHEILLRAVRKQELFCGGAKGFKENHKRQFLSHEYLDRVGQANAYQVIDDHRAAFRRQTPAHLSSDKDWMSYLGQSFLIPNYYMHRADRLSMAYSVEARCPFLDYRFINLAMSIPAAMKVRNSVPKYILKKAFERDLPQHTLYRNKMGFSVPLREWAVPIMSQTIREEIGGFCQRHGVFQEDAVRKHLAELEAGESSHAMSLWVVYFLLAWSRRWLG